MSVGRAHAKETALTLAIRALGWLPYEAVEGVLAALSVAYAIVQPGRVKHALAWARAHRATRWSRARLVISMLAHRGRSVAAARMHLLLAPGEVRGRVDRRGHEITAIPAGSSGRQFLTFHFGPPVASLRLRADGHDFADVGEWWSYLGRPSMRAAWAALPRRASVLWPEGDRAARGIALDRLRKRLRAGEAICLAADGGSGREAFRIEVPGGHVAIGAGWWVLRRLTGAETIPMLTHREGSRMVVTLQPPLPPPVADPVEDARRCRQALAPLIEGHVRRYPEQCVTLAFDSGSAAGREERPEETGRLFGSDAAARGDAVIEPRVVQ